MNVNEWAMAVSRPIQLCTSDHNAAWLHERNFTPWNTTGGSPDGNLKRCDFGCGDGVFKLQVTVSNWNFILPFAVKHFTV